MGDIVLEFKFTYKLEHCELLDPFQWSKPYSVAVFYIYYGMPEYSEVTSSEVIKSNYSSRTVQE